MDWYARPDGVTAGMRAMQLVCRPSLIHEQLDDVGLVLVDAVLVCDPKASCPLYDEGTVGSAF